MNEKLYFANRNRSRLRWDKLACEAYATITVDGAEQLFRPPPENINARPNVVAPNQAVTSSVEPVCSMVANGSGVAILSNLLLHLWSLEGNRIETLTVTDKVTPMSVGLAWHRERKFGPETQAFSNCFHDSFLAPRQLSARR